MTSPKEYVIFKILKGCAFSLLLLQDFHHCSWAFQNKFQHRFQGHILEGVLNCHLFYSPCRKLMVSISFLPVGKARKASLCETFHLPIFRFKTLKRFSC